MLSKDGVEGLLDGDPHFAFEQHEFLEAPLDDVDAMLEVDRVVTVW